MTAEAETDTLQRKLVNVVENVERVIYGKRKQVVMALVGLLAEGHVLLEDAPGTGKTTLARALARSVDLDFRRIQFTSDLLPSDVLGVSVLDPATGDFRFKPGPVFGNVILADELNRTTPRTQSALLECMSDRRVSIDGTTRDVPRPFMVIATQNPLEFEGTYPLPESQLDRFLMRIELGYPAEEDERRVLRSRAEGDPLETLQPVLTAAEAVAAAARVRRVNVDAAIEDYVLAILRETRRGNRFLLGLSSRAGIGLLRACQALALLSGRDYCVPDDVKRLAVPVCAHRVVPRPTDGTDGTDARKLIADLLATVAVPA